MDKKKGGGGGTKPAAKSSGGGGLKAALSNNVLGLKEAQKLSGPYRDSQSLSSLMIKTLKQGGGLGSKLVNAYGSGQLNGGYYSDFVHSNRDLLQPLKGLQLDKGQIYMGSTKQVTPSSNNPRSGYTSGSTTYTPIIGMKGMTIGGAKQANAGGGDKKRGGRGDRNRQRGEDAYGSNNQTKEEIFNQYLSENNLGGTPGTETESASIEPIDSAVEQTQPTSPFSFTGATTFRTKQRKPRGMKSTRVKHNRTASRSMPTSSQLSV